MKLRELLKRYTVDQLKEAIRLSSSLGRVEALNAKRETLMKQVAKIDRKLASFEGTKPPSTGGKTGRRRWKLSAETRRKMSEAAKKRYASSSTDESPAAGSPKKRRALSPEARQKMAEAARRRWAKVKGAPPLPVE